MKKHTKVYTFDSLVSLNNTKYLMLLDGYGVESIKLLDSGLYELQVS